MRYSNQRHYYALKISLAICCVRNFTFHIFSKLMTEDVESFEVNCLSIVSAFWCGRLGSIRELVKLTYFSPMYLAPCPFVHVAAIGSTSSRVLKRLFNKILIFLMAKLYWRFDSLRSSAQICKKIAKLFRYKSLVG